MKYVLAAVLGMLGMVAFMVAIIMWLQLLVLSPLLVSVTSLLAIGAAFGIGLIAPYLRL